jgi:hypothetical protein
MNEILKKSQRPLQPGHLSICIMLCALLSACASQTLFQSNFDPTPVGQPPAHAQPVGTANVSGSPGSVVVVASPVQTGGRWVQVARPNDPVTIVAFQGNFSQFAGDGSYTFDATLFIPPDPAGRTVASVQFEQFNQPVANSFNGFLHLDFLQNGTIRIDDRADTVFGTFPHNQPFIVQVTLNINAAPTAHIVLAGAGTSGQADYKIQAPFIPAARQFGAVRLWMGFPWTGPFDATNIVVTKAQ